MAKFFRSLRYSFRKLEMAKFFSLLRYSFGNEDWRTEEQALNIQPQDHVLCITASGDRPLNLLTHKCQKMVCVDANPAQNYLLQLKAAAMEVLDYETYLAFLGATPCRQRNEILYRLLPYMDLEAVQFWTKHKKMVSKGVLYQGRIERLTSMTAKFFHLIRGEKIQRLFSMNNLEEQRKFLREEWNTYLLRKFFNVMLNICIPRFHLIIKDPGLANFSSNIKPGDYIYDRMNASLERELAKKNLLLSLLLRGKVSPEAFSPYLTEEGTQAIKPRLSVLDIRTVNILDYLESLSEPTFDVFSLSDVASYLSYPDFIRLLKGMIKVAKPGARFCLRQFLSYYEIPQDLQEYFVRDHSLEIHLENIDNCSVYRFMVGKMAPFATETSQLEEKYLVGV